MRLARYLLESQAARASRTLGSATKASLTKPGLKAFLARSLAVGTASLGLFYLQNEQNVLQSQEERFEKEIGSSDDFVDGQMKQIQIGPKKDDDIILVVRLDGKLYAVGAKCSHFGAPLSTGMLFQDLVLCPWHLAAFDVKTGYMETGPMLDSIPTYEIWEKDGKVFAKVPKAIEKNKVQIPTVKRDESNKNTFVIVGGGLAGTSAADTLRQSGFTGEIIMISAEEFMPYDRSGLTKNLFKIEPGQVTLRDSAALDKLGVTIISNSKVVDLDTSSKTVTTDGGRKVRYDKILLATGGSPKMLQVPGADLKGIHYIRDFLDVYGIRDGVKHAKNVVIVGGGLIGAESASNLKLELKEAINVTVICADGYPLQTRLGKEVGEALQKLGEKSGVKFVEGKIVNIQGKLI